MVCKSEVLTLMREPSQNQLESIRTELGEDPERLKQTEDELFHWIESHENFPKNFERNIARNFLRSCRFNMDKTRKKLENHFTAKTSYPEIFSSRSPFSKEIGNIMDTLNIIVLPRLTENGCRVFIFKLENFDSANFDMTAIIKLFFMIYELVLMNNYPVAGDIAIFDTEGFSPSHFVKLLASVKTLVALLREAYAIRLKEIHILNAPPMLDKALSVIKPLLHHKVRNRFTIHLKNETLFKRFGEDILPANYEGKLKDVRELMTDWQKVLTSNGEWFDEQDKMYPANPLPGRNDASKYFKDQLGVDGNFRSLNVD